MPPPITAKPHRNLPASYDAFPRSRRCGLSRSEGHMFGNGDLFEGDSCSASRQKNPYLGFLQRLCRAKAGDFSRANVRPRIGQFEAAQIESMARRGEFMLLRYGRDRALRSLERMDLVQSYRVVEGATPPSINSAAPAGTTRKTRVRKFLERYGDQLLASTPREKPGKVWHFSGRNFSVEFEDAFELRKPRPKRGHRDIKKT